MKLLHLTLWNFGPYRERQRLKFPTPGLYYLTGTNLVNPELEANAVGKSKLIDALFWAFYGCSAEGLKAGALRSWGETGGYGAEVSFESGSKTYLLSRTWSPNTLRLQVDSGEPENVDQARVDGLVGLSPDAFLCSIISAQFTRAFVDLRPEERMSLFSEVMSLERWEDASVHASKTAGGLREQDLALDRTLAGWQGELLALRQNPHEQNAKQWEQQHTSELSRLQGVLSNAKKALGKRPEPTANLQRQLALLREEERQHNKELTRTVISEAAAQKGWESLQGSECPTCGREWPKPEAEQIKARKNAQHWSEVLRVEREKQQGLEQRVRKLEAQYASSAQESRDYERVATEVDAAKRDLERVQAESNPYTEHLRLAKARKQELDSEIAKVSAERAELAQLLEASTFWAKGFKDVRLYLIEESLTHLNVEVNESLFHLGLQGWSIQFAVEQETKSGSVKRGFQCMVHAPDADGPVPWEAYSGGERQRIRRAINFGLANLISERSGTSTNVEFYDEPTGNMTRGGIHALLDRLKERAQKQNKAIFLADHRVLDYGGFAGVLHVEKSVAGSAFTLRGDRAL